MLPVTESGGAAFPDAAGIFISYRRQEANYLAGWLHDQLADHFGESRVFLDIDWIKPGLDFMEVIDQAISRSAVLLVIIGSRWLAPGQDGAQRLGKPDDPVRLELEMAFRRGVRVIPLLLDGAVMPRVTDLPHSMAKLARVNALRIDYESFRTDVSRLLETLEEELHSVSVPVVETAEGASVSPHPPPRRADLGDRTGRDIERVEQQRSRLLGRLSRTYGEHLNQSLAHENMLRLQLDLDWIPNKTFQPQDQILMVPQRRARRLPAGTSLLQAFDTAGGLTGDGLLVLGEPGAGKSTLLIELALRLVERARVDPSHPVPVYLSLSSWAARRLPLGEWLVDELAELYEVPHSLGRGWTDDAQLLFVLDGLDEIPDRNDRAACVKAINQFNRFGRSYRIPMLVASRPAEYDSLPIQLYLEAAVEVRPLNPSMVLGHLQQAGPGMRTVLSTVQRDPELRELLRSPLLVSMLTLTYSGTAAVDTHATTGTVIQRRHQLIIDYVDRRFELDRLGGSATRKGSNDYPPGRTRAWLSALALNLTRHRQTVLLLGRMQPDWLPTRWAQLIVVAAPGLSFGLFGGLFAAPLIGLTDALADWLLISLGAGLGAWLVGRPQPTERPSWSWARTRSGLPVALIASLGFGLLYGLIKGPRAGQAVALMSVPCFVLIGGLSGLRAGLFVGLCTGSIVALNFGLIVTLIVTLGAGPIMGLDFEPGSLRIGLFVGLFIGLDFGLTVGLGAGLASWPQPAERLSWSWTRARSRLAIALGAGLVFGLLYGLGVGMERGLRDGLQNGLAACLFFGSIVGLTYGLSKSLIPIYVTPNEGVRRSIQNGLVVTIISGILVGMVVGTIFSPGSGLNYGLLLGLLAGHIFGLGVAAQHHIFRLLLWKYGIAPLRYIHWLNYTVRLRLLFWEASGGYVFIHRIVQDYFAGGENNYLDSADDSG